MTEMRFRVTMRIHNKDFLRPYRCYMITVFDPVSKLCIKGELDSQFGLKYYKFLVERMEREILERIC
jgi:hypothetical protein